MGPNSMAANWRWMESECIGILQSVKMTDALAFVPLHTHLQRLPFHLAQSQVHFTVRNRMTDCAGDMQLCAKVWMGCALAMAANWRGWNLGLVSAKTGRM